MSRFSERVAASIRARGLLAPGDRVLVALSGGPDSVALIHVLHEMAPQFQAAVVAVGHLHHGLRGEAADGDEVFCNALAARLGLRIVSEHVDVATEARARKQSIERTARDLRYAFFDRAREQTGASLIALGHTLDDQAETFLLRLMRGAGPRGLAAMWPRRGAIIRPLLDVSRAQVLQYLRDQRLSWREDASNRDLSIPRNRVRHLVLPVLAQEWPAVRRVLAREAELARDDEIELMHATEKASGGVLGNVGSVTLHLPALGALPPALRRRLVWLAIERKAGGRFIGWRHVQAVLRLTETPGEGVRAIALPGVEVVRSGDTLVIASRTERPACPLAATEPPFSYLLPVPGAVEVPEAGLSLTAELGTIEPGGGLPVSNPLEAILDAARLSSPLIVRSRRPGDRVRPLGLGGTRKLQDVLVDRKVPADRRDRLPLVTDPSGEIAWVVGLTIAEPFRVRSDSTTVLLLKATRAGGSS